MDFFDSRYFRINKKCLRLLGLWPYQSRIEKILIRPPFVTSFILVCAPHALSIVINLRLDITRVLQALTAILYLTMILMKMVVAILTEYKFKIMYDHIAQNWTMIKDEEDLKILHKNSEFGRFLTIGYMSYMFSALLVFNTVPMLPIVLDIISPLNESRPLIFVLDGEYFVNRLDHYKAIYAFESFSSSLSVIIFSTVDSTYAVSVQQCVSLMNVVRLRLDAAKKVIKDSKFSEIQERKIAHSAVINAIQFHQKALDFANVLESTYNLTYLVVVCLNAAILSVSSATIIMNLHRPTEAFRFIMAFVGFLIHLFYIAWSGQQVIDASSEVVNHVHSTNWYRYSLETQKLLIFMIMRSKVPCQLTGGGVCVLNVENFGAIMKTSMSYITVFASML